MLAPLTPRPEEPIYETLANKLKQLAAQLPAHSKLPSIRSIAQETGLSTSTVVAALDLLAAAGVIYKRRGSGCYVAPNPTQGPLPLDDEFLPREIPADRIDFTLGTPSPEYFPVADFKEAFTYVLDRDRGYAFSYPELLGYLPLRLTIAQQLEELGVSVSPDAVLVTAGAQQAIALVAQTLLQPGDGVCIEDPTYPGAVQVMQQLGVKLIPLPVGPHGPRPTDLIAASKSRPKLYYAVPNFQNPTGGSYSPVARQTLLELAQQLDFYILEDDHVSDLYYSGAKPPTLWQEAPQRVLYVKSFSKLLMPGLRLGFLVLPRKLQAAISKAKRTADLGSPGLNQRVLDAYLRSGKWSEYRDFLRQTYQHRSQVLYEALRRNVGNAATYYPLRGGLNAWLSFPRALDARRLQALCAEQGVFISPGCEFAVTPASANHCVRISIAATFPDRIEAGIQILAQCVERLL
ncbi:MAG TPA: PLP-dependent aminotransferase family protein [Firmicutes bacterium]|nr:PLP-dependent aminotransferase family protein [Bacillota bacterium]